MTELAEPVHVLLGGRLPDGLAPAILAIVDRGVLLRPGLAASLQAAVELSSEGFPPVGVLCSGPDGVLVQDGPLVGADVRIQGPLPAVVGLLAAPVYRGVPNPRSAEGRDALRMLARREVQISGRIALLRAFLELVRI